MEQNIPWIQNKWPWQLTDQWSHGTYTEVGEGNFSTYLVKVVTSVNPTGQPRHISTIMLICLLLRSNLSGRFIKTLYINLG